MTAPSWWRLRRLGGTLGRLAQLRRSLQLLASLDQRLAEQNTYLARLADEFAPALPAADPAAQSGSSPLAPAEVTFLDESEAADVESYTARFSTQHGRPPTDDEALEFLAERAERAFLSLHRPRTGRG
jgi:hypothetical protein